MHKYITNTKYIGPPQIEHLSHTVVKQPNSYFVTWYVSKSHIGYHVSGPAVLLAITALVAAMANINPNDIDESVIKQKLDLHANEQHHLDFVINAIRAGLARLND